MSTGLDFTTLARVREILGFPSSDTSKDALISQMITAASARIEDEMRRKAKKQAYTELYELPEARHVLMLRAAPVDAAQAVTIKANGTADFTSATALTANRDFVLNPQAGIVRFYTTWQAPRRAGSSYPAGPIFVQVAYTGGLATDTAGLIAAYPDLAEATDLQASYLFRRRATPGGNVTVGAGSTSFEEQYGLLKEVQALIARHTRRDWN